MLWNTTKALEAIATGVDAITTRVEAIAFRLAQKHTNAIIVSASACPASAYPAPACPAQCDLFETLQVGEAA